MRDRTTNHRRERRSERGAALVEAAVVIPVMLVFLGCIMFTHKSYQTKLDRQTNARSSALYYASHACKGDVPQGLSSDVVDTNTGGDSGDATKGGSKVGSSSEGLSRNWTMVRVNPGDTSVTGSAIDDRQTVVLQRSVSAFAMVGCNERPRGSSNPISEIYNFVKDCAASGCGFL